VQGGMIESKKESRRVGNWPSGSVGSTPRNGRKKKASGGSVTKRNSIWINEGARVLGPKES